jgi:hypothetical protein
VVPDLAISHTTAQHAKSEYLAVEDHLAAWNDRYRANQEELDARLPELALPCDLSASIQVAQWAYEQAEKANGQVWVAERVLRHLGAGWRTCLSA